MKQIWIWPFIFSVACSCSLMNKVAIKSSADIMYQGSDVVLTESNWHQFNLSTPANLKMLEGFWYAGKKNEKLLALLIKGYAGYAFTTYETKGLRDLLLGKDDSFELDQAILNYEKAIFYGLKYLELKGISSKQFFAKEFSLNLASIFNSKLNSSIDRVAMFYMAQALGSSINLQRKNIKKLSLLGNVRSMINWVCGIDKLTFENGACLLFEAIIMANTPTMLGGSQSIAKKLFHEASNKQPENLLIMLSFIQYHLVPMLEEEEFSVEMEKLNRKLVQWNQYRHGNLSKENKRFSKHTEFNLYNSIAFERFEILMKTRKDIF